MLTRNICAEFGGANIQCNGIGPGYIATPQTAPLREKQPDGSRHPFDQFIVSKTPAGRWGTTEDLEGPAVFLASHNVGLRQWPHTYTSTAAFLLYRKANSKVKKTLVHKDSAFLSVIRS